MSHRLQDFVGGWAEASVSGRGSGGGAGTRMRMPQDRQRTVLPRATAGTDRIERHLRLGQIMRTEPWLMEHPSLEVVAETAMVIESIGRRLNS